MIKKLVASLALAAAILVTPTVVDAKPTSHTPAKTHTTHKVKKSKHTKHKKHRKHSKKHVASTRTKSGTHNVSVKRHHPQL